MPKRLRRKTVAERYDVDPRSVSRWVEDKKFPKPDFYIGRNPYWTEETLEKHDRESTKAAAASNKSGAASATPA